MEQEFLKDQRSNKNMIIGNIDKAITSALKKKEVRKSKELQIIVKFNQERTKILVYQKRLLATMTVVKAITQQCFFLPEEANLPGPSNIQEKSLPGPSKLKEEKNTQMRLKLPPVAFIADRIGI